MNKIPIIKTAISQSGQDIVDNDPDTRKKISIGVCISNIEKATNVNVLAHGINVFPLLKVKNNKNFFAFICYDYYYELII